jgi:hypothetical protein
MSLRQWRRWPIYALLCAFSLVGVPPRAAETAAEAKARASEARLRRDVTYLASDECEGRGPSTKGINLAADYIAAEFKKAGLQPGGKDGSFFQPFTIPGATLEAPAHLVLKGPKGQEIELKQGIHFEPLGLSHAGKVTAPVVFAGYGVTGNKDLLYDDYQGLDAEDKVVIVLRDTPRGTNKYVSFDGQRRRQHASFTQKMVNAVKHKAAAILFVNDADTAATGDDLLGFGYTSLSGSPANLPAFHLRRSVLEAMLQGSAAADLADLERDIDRELKPRGVDLTGWTVSLDVKVRRDKITIKNVVGVLNGAGPLANETVVVGAHYDHLGYFSTSSMAVASGLKKGAIHHGADDNGSGTTSIMELARRFGQMPERQGRRLVFIAFSGEELGLYGSDHYCKAPLFPLDDTAAMFNLDMVGRLRPDKETKKDRLLIEGSGTAKAFNELLDTLNKKYDFKMVKKASGFGPSDHASFCGKKIPVLFFWTDYHDDYHRPSDTADKINVEGMRRIVDLGEEVVTYLTTVEKKPEFVEVKGGSGPGPSITGPRLGIRPNYSDEGEGVLIGGVTDGEPAAKAGIKGGDRIIEMDGKPVKNLETYMTIMSGHKKGDTIEVQIMRDGKKQTVKVKLD